jgi:hypothetical protein
MKRRLSLTSALLLSAVLALLVSQPAAAYTDDPPGRVARIRYLQGSVSFEPAGASEWVSAVTNRPMTRGDRLWADAGSRAEVEIGSAVIRVNENTGFSFLNLDDRTVQIDLSEGTLGVTVHRLRRNEDFEVDTPNEAFTVFRPGLYRIQANADGNSSMVVTRSGEGEVTGAGSTYTVSSGQSGTFTGTNSLYGQVVSVGGYDDFDNWSRDRDRYYDQSRSVRYVSNDVVGYEDLDNNGVWRSVPSYGYIWTPTSVPSGWAPYRYGHWIWVSPWGWTWVDDAPWGYAPFHYGRWVNVQGSWGWVPGPRTIEPVYAPALVAFIGGSGFGLSIGFGGGNGYAGDVGWFPLAPREVFVPSYGVSPDYLRRVNVSNTTVNYTTITNVYNSYNSQAGPNPTAVNLQYANRTVPGAVTAVPQNVFTSAQPVAITAVKVNAQQVAKAPVVARAAVAPTTNSVLGASAASANKVPQPRATMINRPVVAKAAPPPPPVPFAKQQQALAAHPGQPLAPHEVQQLRPADTASAPAVKPAPPGKPTAPNTKPANQPVTANAKQPAGPPAAAPTPPTNRPANQPPANAKATPPASQPQPARPYRPPAARPYNPQAAANRAQPPSPPSANKPPNQPASPSAKVNRPANEPEAAQANRPPAARPNNPPPAANRAQPPSPPPANKPANQPLPPSARANPPEPAGPNRPPAAQPNNLPPAATRAQPPSAPPPPSQQQQPKAQPPHSAPPPQTPAEKAREEEKKKAEQQPPH